MKDKPQAGWGYVQTTHAKEQSRVDQELPEFHSTKKSLEWESKPDIFPKTEEKTMRTENKDLETTVGLINHQGRAK